MKNRFLLSAVLLCLFLCSQAQWLSMNPGAGGRVQGVSCDPTIPGRMFVASDMEGYYYSDDYGSSWNFAAQNLHTGFVLLTKGRGTKFFVGHALGLSVSTDMGDTYTLAAPTKDKTIGVIEFDPSDNETIYAGISWLGNDGAHLNHYPIGHNPNGANGFGYATTNTVKEIFYSTDGGDSWNTSSWDNYNLGDGRAVSIQVNPTLSSDVLLATFEGLFESVDIAANNWSPIAAPQGAVDQSCYGADFTQDGNWIYAIYRMNDGSHLFVRPRNGSDWQDLGKGNWPIDNGRAPSDSRYRETNMFQPKVYQGGNVNEHYVLIGQRDQNPADALYEGRFTTNGSSVTGSIERVMGYVDARIELPPYNVGWNLYTSICRNNSYYPVSWNGDAGNPHERGVFTMSQQSFFTGDAADGNQDWRVVSTGFVKQINGENFWRTRGTASTFTYDMAAYQNYVIQVQADNGAVESWDGGYTWRQAQLGGDLVDAHGVHILPNNGNPIVLMSITNGFGGGGGDANTARLMFKNLNLAGPDGTAHGFMQLIAPGQNANRRGLPNNKIFQFHNDPFDEDRLFVLTFDGLYVCEDIYDFIAGGSSQFRKIQSENTNNQRSQGLEFHPTNPDIIYYKDGTGSYEGTKGGDGNYTWVRMTRGNGTPVNKLQRGGLAAVQKGSNIYLYTYVQGEGIARADNGSTNFGTIVLSDDDAIDIELGGKPVWWEEGRNEISVGDLIAVEDELYVPYQQWDEYRVGYGILKGEVQDNGSVNWSNWTGDNIYNVVRQIKHYEGVIYLATQGSGIQARKVNGTFDPAPAINEDDYVHPEPPAFFPIFTDVEKARNLLWEGIDSPMSNVETSSSPGQASEGSLSQFVQGLTRSQPGDRPALLISFDPVDATDGTLIIDLYGIGGAMNTVNIKLFDKFNGFKDLSPLVNVAANRFTTFSVPVEGGTLDPAELNRIQIETFGNGTDKLYIDNIQIQGDGIAYSTTGNVPVSEVVVTPDVVTIPKGETLTIAVDVLPSNAGDKSVSYATSNSSVVSLFGPNLTANTPGTATVTVTSNSNPEISGQVVITVTEPVTGVNLSPDNNVLNIGETLTLSAEVLPFDATDLGVTFASSNPSIFTVDNSGIVTAVSVGIASAVVTTDDGSFMDDVQIEVVESAGPTPGIYRIKNLETGKYIRATSLTGNSNLRADGTSTTDDRLLWTVTSTTDDYFSLVSDYSGKKIRPKNTADNINIRQFSPDVSAFVEWSATAGSSDDVFYLVNRETGKQMRPTSSTNTALIQVPAENTAYTQWEFEPVGDNSPVSVTSVSLSPANATMMVGASTSLTASVSPANATNQSVSYSSSNTSVATVSGAGVVSAVAVGTATITVTTQDGGFTDQATVTVEEIPAGGEGNGSCDATSPAGKPNPPCQVQAIVLSSSSVRLMWNDNSDNETCFDVQAFRETDQWRGGGMPDPAANATSVDITNLMLNQRYTFRIKAIGSAGGSVWVETDQVDLSGGARFETTANPSINSTFQLYPNPVNSTLNIRLGELDATGYKVYDGAGRIVENGLINKGLKVLNINTTGFESGLYFIRIADRTEMFIKE